MQYPDFYHPEHVGTLYVPRTLDAMAAGVAPPMTPASHDRRRTLLLLVDAQVDFIHPDGALSVPGAVADTQRTIEWIFRNAAHLTTIAASLDTHVPIQIFYPTWWADADGNHPGPYTSITSEDVRDRRWIPLIEPEWSQCYVTRLEEQSRKVLMIWPYHTLIGTPGHALTPALYEAVAYHSAARGAQPIFLKKGDIPRTEHYSILEPEVKIPEERARGGELNEEFLHTLSGYDRVYIAGQAKSHCVLETLASLMRYFEHQPENIQKFRLLADCTSSVAHPEIDFEAIASQVLAGYAALGLALTTSEEDIM
jgi:nicotinamidase-related amidase